MPSKRPADFLWLLVAAWVVLMLASLVWSFFDPFFFSSDGQSAQGIDFFSTPKAFRNLLEGRSMYDSWGGTRYVAQTTTWYLMHPAFTVVVASWLALFSPWVSYTVFVATTLAIFGFCGHQLASLTHDRFEQQMAYALLLCSFVTYWL